MGRRLCQQWAQAMYCRSMSVFPLRLPFERAALALACCCLISPTAQSQAQADKTTPATSKPATPDKPADDKSALPPLPPEAHSQQAIMLDGKTLKYTVTVGALPVRDKDGKVAGEVVVTSYAVDGDNRPVT